MGNLTEMTCIAAITVFVVDLSGFTETWKGWLSRWLGVRVGRVRPFDCSLCSVFWTLTLWLLCTGRFTLPDWAFACLLAALSSQMGQAVNLLRYGLDSALKLMNSIFDRIWKRN